MPVGGNMKEGSSDAESPSNSNGLNVGTVIRAYVGFTTPPKVKRFIVVGLHDNGTQASIVLINSEVHGTLFNSDYLKDNHVVDITDIKEKIISDPTIVIGSVDKDDLADVIRTIKGSILIKPRIKSTYGINNYNLDNEEGLKEAAE